MITFSGWAKAGQPWAPAQCIADFAAIMRRHGFTVYILGNTAHQHADPPEDHVPYSSTPWPGTQPYPKVLACDVMPGGETDWRAVGERIVNERNAGVPGTEFIKYINYTDRSNRCWHASWMPRFMRVASGDTGHIHVSARTDWASAHTAYDPVTPNPAPTVTPEDPEDRMYALIIPSGAGVTVELPNRGNPGDKPAFTIATDTGAGGTTSRWRIAHQDGDGKWTVATDRLDLDSQHRRHDVICPQGTLNTSLSRVARTAGDTCDQPTTVMVWW